MLAIYTTRRQDRVELDRPCRRKVVITTYRKQRIRDHANLVGGCKGLIDALVNAQLLHDDSDLWMEAEYHQELASKSPTGKPYTIVQITHLNPPASGKEISP